HVRELLEETPPRGLRTGFLDAVRTVACEALPRLRGRQPGLGIRAERGEHLVHARTVRRRRAGLFVARPASGDRRHTRSRSPAAIMSREPSGTPDAASDARRTRAGPCTRPAARRAAPRR